MHLARRRDQRRTLTRADERIANVVDGERSGRKPVRAPEEAVDEPRNLAPRLDPQGIRVRHGGQETSSGTGMNVITKSPIVSHAATRRAGSSGVSSIVGG